MKIAIFHNFMDNIGGAEYVDLIMARELGADIFTTNIDRDKIRKMGFSSDRIFSIGRVPVHAPLRQELTYRRFRYLNLKKRYDCYIIAGDWAMAAGRHNQPNLWYVYSPIREIWDLRDYVKKNMVGPAGGPAAGMLFGLWSQYHRTMNRRNLKYINRVVAISSNVQQRVSQYLGRQANVVYPPTETARYHYGRAGEYWLSVNRLITHKRVDLQLKAFARLPQERLVVVGSYEQSAHFQRYASYIQRIKPANVELRSWVSAQELIELYANCKAFITTAYKEDYGMTPVEAMAAGKPVIAPAEGGYPETVQDGPTGRLIVELNEDTLTAAIASLSAELKNPEVRARYRAACQARAKKFDTAVFIEKLKKEISQVVTL